MCSTQGQDADLLGAIATWRKWPVFGYAMLQSWQGGQSLTTLARFTSQKQVGPNPAKSRASLRVGALDRIPRTGGEGRILTEHRVKLCPRRWVSVALTGFYPFFFRRRLLFPLECVRVAGVYTKESRRDGDEANAMGSMVLPLLICDPLRHMSAWPHRLICGFCSPFWAGLVWIRRFHEHVCGYQKSKRRLSTLRVYMTGAILIDSHDRV